MTRFNDILNGIKNSMDKTTKAGCGCSSPDSTNVYPENEYQEDRLSLLSENDNMTNEKDQEKPPEEEVKEYKQDFYEMSVGSIKSIMTHANNILNALDDPSTKNNLTESWLQGKIAITEDYMITIHNFVMFGPSETDTEGSEKKKINIENLPHYTHIKDSNPGVTTPESFADTNRPGLWENIRKKKQKEGKKYRPAKPGDKDRPKREQWKNLTKASYDYRCPVCGLRLEYERKKANYNCPRDGSIMYLD